MTRDYDEEEQGYDSEKEGEEDDDERKSDSDSASSPKGPEEMERSEGQIPKKSKLNGDDHHQEDMEMSDWEHPEPDRIIFPLSSFIFLI